MKKNTFANKCLLHSLVLFVALFSIVAPMAGCTKAEVVQAIDTLEAQLPQIAQMAGGLTLLVAPEYAPLIAPGAAVIAADGKLLESLLVGYNPAVPNPTVLQKINAVWADIQTNLAQITTAVGIKDARTSGIVQSFAGLIGLIAQNIVLVVQHQTPAVTAYLQMRLPAVFGVAGMYAIALDGNLSGGAPAKNTTVRPKLTARDIAKHWNKLCSGQPKAKIPVPRAHVLGVPVPFTGAK